MTPFTSDDLLLLILVLWTLPWKVYALWTASKSNHRKWFLALVILNTFGILEIVYIFIIAKKKWSEMRDSLINFVTLKSLKK